MRCHSAGRVQWSPLLVLLNGLLLLLSLALSVVPAAASAAGGNIGPFWGPPNDDDSRDTSHRETRSICTSPWVDDDDLDDDENDDDDDENENGDCVDDDDDDVFASYSRSDSLRDVERPLAPPCAPPPPPLRAPAEEALAHAVQFLPLRDMETARRVGGVLARAVSWTSVTPDFVPDGQMLFMKWLEVPQPRPAVVRSVRATYRPFCWWWRCVCCGGLSSSQHEVCVHCHAPIDAAACRVFLGQLPKQCTAAAVSHLLRVLAPDVRPLHVESHSNHAGRDRGCAWVYLRNLADCVSLLQLHKHVFFDEDEDGEPGFWLLRHDDYTAALERFAGKRCEGPRSVSLPRRPLVAELPISSCMHS